MDLDLDRRELTVSRQLVHTDDGLIACPPKTAASRRIVALDLETVRLLRRHEQAQRQRLGDAWNESGPVFARADRSPMRPDYITVRFRQLVQAGGLPFTADLMIKEIPLMTETAVDIEHAGQPVEERAVAASGDQLIAMLVDRARSQGLQLTGEGRLTLSNN